MAQLNQNVGSKSGRGGKLHSVRRDLKERRCGHMNDLADAEADRMLCQY